MQVITTPNGPAPIGHYSQAIEHGGVVYVSGQLPIVPGASEHNPGTIEEQTRQALANIEAILQSANSDLQHALMVTIYLSDLSLFGQVNAVYAEVMGDHKPARAAVPVNDLPLGYGLEIAVTAAVRED